MFSSRSVLLCSNVSQNIVRLDGRYAKAASLAAPMFNSNDAAPWFIGGNYIAGEHTKEAMNVLNPATDVVEGKISVCGEKETNMAITAASEAFPAWSGMIARDRAVILRKWSDLIMKHQSDLAAIMTRECGKTLMEAVGENAYSARYVEWYASEAERTYGDIIPSPRGGARTTVLKKPVGVVGIITPWNFPSAMITRAAAGALAAGCTVVVKPAESTPFSALALAELATEAGVPAGVFNLVGGDAQSIGKAMTAHNDVRKISFTGSTRVGKLLMKESCDTVKKVAMELGGNAPFIVFEDADIEKAADGLMAAKFRNAGQTCVCANRVFVHEDVYEKFVATFLKRVEKLKVGYGMEKGISCGPLISREAVHRVEGLIVDAQQNGGKVAIGGTRSETKFDKSHPTGNFLAPTVLTDIPHTSRICQEEIFGPALPILKFKDEGDVIKMANSTRAGLAAYFYTENYKRQWRVSEALQFGMVGVNDGMVSSTCAPFGGVKESGLGRDGSKYGIDAFMDIRYVLHSNL